MLDLPPVPPLYSPSSPQLKASPLPNPTRPRKRALCPSPHHPPGLCMLNSLSSPVLELALNGKSLAGKKRKLLKAPGFQQEARPPFSSETLRDLCSPAPMACRQGQDHKWVSARPSLSPDVVVLKQFWLSPLYRAKPWLLRLLVASGSQQAIGCPDGPTQRTNIFHAVDTRTSSQPR